MALLLGTDTHQVQCPDRQVAQAGHQGVRVEHIPVPWRTAVALAYWSAPATA